MKKSKRNQPPAYREILDQNGQVLHYLLPIQDFGFVPLDPDTPFCLPSETIGGTSYGLIDLLTAERDLRWGCIQSQGDGKYEYVIYAEYYYDTWEAAFIDNTTEVVSRFFDDWNLKHIERDEFIARILGFFFRVGDLDGLKAVYERATKTKDETTSVVPWDDERWYASPLWSLFLSIHGLSAAAVKDPQSVRAVLKKRKALSMFYRIPLDLFIQKGLCETNENADAPMQLDDLLAPEVPWDLEIMADSKKIRTLDITSNHQHDHFNKKRWRPLWWEYIKDYYESNKRKGLGYYGGLLPLGKGRFLTASACFEEHDEPGTYVTVMYFYREGNDFAQENFTSVFNLCMEVGDIEGILDLIQHDDYQSWIDKELTDTIYDWRYEDADKAIVAWLEGPCGGQFRDRHEILEHVRDLNDLKPLKEKGFNIGLHEAMKIIDLGDHRSKGTVVFFEIYEDIVSTPTILKLLFTWRELAPVLKLYGRIPAEMTLEDMFRQVHVKIDTSLDPTLPCIGIASYRSAEQFETQLLNYITYLKERLPDGIPLVQKVAESVEQATDYTIDEPLKSLNANNDKYAQALSGFIQTIKENKIYKSSEVTACGPFLTNGVQILIAKDYEQISETGILFKMAEGIIKSISSELCTEVSIDLDTYVSWDYFDDEEEEEQTALDVWARLWKKAMQQFYFNKQR